MFLFCLKKFDDATILKRDDPCSLLKEGLLPRLCWEAGDSFCITFGQNNKTRLGRDWVEATRSQDPFASLNYETIETMTK